MKDDPKYGMYLEWLAEEVSRGRLGKGAMALKKMSVSSFEQFKSKLDADTEARLTSLSRDKKIDDLFDDFDFD
jgi:hypothetical protein